MSGFESCGVGSRDSGLRDKGLGLKVQSLGLGFDRDEVWGRRV